MQNKSVDSRKKKTACTQCHHNTLYLNSRALSLRPSLHQALMKAEYTACIESSFPLPLLFASQLLNLKCDMTLYFPSYKLFTKNKRITVLWIHLLQYFHVMVYGLGTFHENICLPASGFRSFHQGMSFV